MCWPRWSWSHPTWEMEAVCGAGAAVTTPLLSETCLQTSQRVCGVSISKPPLGWRPWLDSLWTDPPVRPPALHPCPRPRARALPRCGVSSSFQPGVSVENPDLSPRFPLKTWLLPKASCVSALTTNLSSSPRECTRALGSRRWARERGACFHFFPSPCRPPLCSRPCVPGL